MEAEIKRLEAASVECEKEVAAKKAALEKLVVDTSKASEAILAEQAAAKKELDEAMADLARLEKAGPAEVDVAFQAVEKREVALACSGAAQDSSRAPPDWSEAKTFPCSHRVSVASCEIETTSPLGGGLGLTQTDSSRRLDHVSSKSTP